MKLSINDIIIIVDTLIGSASISDANGIFRYKKEARFNLAHKLSKKLEQINLNIDIEVKGV